MKLRYQLLFVSLLLLVLPWSAWQYLAAFDNAARKSQADGLVDQVKLIANRVALEETLFSQPFIEANRGATTAYAFPLESAPIVDGYGDDWRNYELPINQDNDVKWQLGADQRQFYFFIQIKDQSIHYFNPSLGRLSSGDRLEITILSDDDQSVVERYILQTSAPGNVTAILSSEERHGFSPQAEAVWRETAEGYQLEIAISRAILRKNFHINIIDDDGRGEQVTTLTAKPLSIVTHSQAFSRLLKKLYSDGTRLSLLNKDQWLIADIGPQYNAYRVSQTPWIVEWFYRRLLESENLPFRKTTTTPSYIDYRELAEARDVGQALRWYRSGQRQLRSQTIASVAVPVVNQKKTLIAYILLEKNTDQLVALTASAFSQLFVYSIGGLLFVMLALLFYANWLSLRIRRLNRAANDVVNEKGDMQINEYPWPDLKRKDELADLSKGYRKLLLRVQEYNDYLRDLSNKLSHELRTPIAVVKSSLENLSQVDDPELQQSYHQRAQQGIVRLDSILQAMSAANRIEASLANAEFKTTDLDDFFNTLCAVYNDAYAEHEIIFKNDIGSLDGLLSQELFVQMMDKLIDNAVSFSSPENPIVMTLSREKDYWQLSIDNIGPLLPDDMQSRLFDSMVSLRRKERAGATHLGLGLYIVRLITELHQGDVHAKNRDDDRGVIFYLQLPL